MYRVLTQFEAAGLVSRHHFEDGMAVFELNQGTHHDHIVCLECGRVEEFMDSGIEDRQNAVAERLGFEIRDHSMVLYGKCKRNPCPNRKKAGAAVRKSVLTAGIIPESRALNRRAAKRSASEPPGD